MRASAFLAAQHKAMTDEEFADAKALANLVLINDWLLAIGAIPSCLVCDGTGRMDDISPCPRCDKTARPAPEGTDPTMHKESI